MDYFDMVNYNFYRVRNKPLTDHLGIHIRTPVETQDDFWYNKR